MAIRSGTPSPGPTGGVDPALLATLSALASGQGGTASTGRVYMGQISRMTGRDEDRMSGPLSSRLAKQMVDRWASTEEAEQEYYTWTLNQQKAFTDQAILAGLLKLGDGPLEGAAIWKKFVKEAANYGAAGQKVSPIDLMAAYKNASGGGNSWRSAGVWEINTQTGERRYTGPGTYLGNGQAQQVDTRVDLTDPDTARAISTKLFQDLMGRDPGEGELAAFANALHTAEQASPVVSTTTTQYDMDTGQALSSSSTQSGGLTGEARAYIGEQQIKKKKEYGVTQAVTTYQNAFENLIYGSPG